MSNIGFGVLLLEPQDLLVLGEAVMSRRELMQNRELRIVGDVPALQQLPPSTRNDEMRSLALPVRSMFVVPFASTHAKALP